MGPIIRVGREIQCLPYAGFFKDKSFKERILSSQTKCKLNFIYLNKLQSVHRKFH